MESSRHVVVSETEATVICDAFQQRGELSAVAELRRLFPGVTDNRLARECAHTIAGWKPLRPVKRGAAAARSLRSERELVAITAPQVGPLRPRITCS